MDTTIANSNHEEELFSQAEKNWNLPVIYEQVEAVNHKLFGERQLTSLQKAILRGLLCNHSPEEIAILLPVGMRQSMVSIIWNLHKCVKCLVNIESTTVESYRDIPRWLASAGFNQPKASQTTTIIQKTNSTHRGPVSVDESSKSSSSTEIKVVKNEITQNSFDQQNVPLSQQNIKLSVSPDSEHSQIELSQQNIKLSVSPDSEHSQIEPNYDSGSLSLIDNQHQIDPVEENLVLVDENDFMPSISRWTKLGGIFLAGSVGILIILSAFTPYKVNVKAKGTVRPVAGLKIVEATTEGKITDIRVKENQVVRKGDIIAELDRSRLDTRSDQLEIGIQQANLQLKQIEAQIEAQKNRLLAETERNDRKITAAKSQLDLRRREYQDRQVSTNAQVNEAQANLGLAQEELSQAKTELISTEANLKSAQAALNSAKSKQERYRDIAESGAISQNLYDEVILDVQQKEQDLVIQQAAITRQQQEIARRNQAVAAAQARLNNVSTTINPSNGEVEIAVDNVAQEEAARKVSLATLQQEQEALIQQRIEIQKQLERESKELTQLKQDTEQSTISASTDGILFQLKIRNPGQTVSSGEEIARIAPSNVSLSIEALIPAQEISKVEPGQITQTKISACPYPDYGTLKGVVSNVAPDTISSGGEDSSRGGAAFFKVTISPESLTFGQQNNQCSLQLGMEGQTDITTKSDTVLKFMLRKAKLLTDV